MKKIEEIKKVHILGIGGSALSGVAKLLLKNGIEVTGSDMAKSATTEELSELGIKIFDSQVKENIEYNPDVVIITPAILFLNPNQEEMVYAREKGIDVITWQEFLGQFLKSSSKIGLMTSGSEGKGTTCGILAWLLKDTIYDPFMILGANLKNINGDNKATNFYFGNGNTYIVEADEFNRNFHNYHPDFGMMVNFQYEHPEVYANFAEYKKSFYEFFQGMQGAKTLIFRATRTMVDFVKEYNLHKTHKIIWYRNDSEEFTVECDYVIRDVKLLKNKKGISFMLDTPQGVVGMIINSLPLYLANNATASIICALELGIPLQEVWEKLQKYEGFERRFEIFYFGNDGTIITDYGHSPSSIKQIVKEVRTIYPEKKLHLIFQPHLFSRTYNFMGEFIEEISKVDRVSLVDIYPARERKEEWEDKVSSPMLCEKLKAKGIDATYIGVSSEVHNALAGKIIDGEVSVFMGAGDMNKSYKKLFTAMGAKN